MSHKIGRNDPCPCGSGKKYKQCHLGSDDDPARRELPPTTEEVALQAQEAPPLPGWTRLVPYAVLGLGGVGAVALWATRGAQEALAVAGGAALVFILWTLLSKPPPPRDGAGDPAGLNFGRKD